ncbi:MAG: hypothetical protein IID08_01220 [Candidatus Hydrogenedentes bacterium]|nr:hypothetical protein [Candidatus Hydrogenedentota bacterium]
MEISYSENFNILVALITHLGATDRASSTPTVIARKLGFEKGKVVDVVEGFPAFFRESRRTSKDEVSKGDHFYTLHMRYSRRKLDKEEDGESQPLATDEIVMLINLVAHMVEQEQQNSRSKYTSIFTLIAAIIAAIAAIFAALG